MCKTAFVITIALTGYLFYELYLLKKSLKRRKILDIAEIEGLLNYEKSNSHANKTDLPYQEQQELEPALELGQELNREKSDLEKKMIETRDKILMESS